MDGSRRGSRPGIRLIHDQDDIAILGVDPLVTRAAPSMGSVPLCELRPTRVRVAVQDATPETLAFVRGAEIDEAGEELEFTPIIAYAVQAKPGAGDTVEALRGRLRRRHVLA